MTRARAALDALLVDATTRATAIVEAEARRIMARHPSLHGFVDAMGATYFVGANGQPLDERDLPKMAREMVESLMYDYYRSFGSSGLDIRR